MHTVLHVLGLESGIRISSSNSMAAANAVPFSRVRVPRFGRDTLAAPPGAIRTVQQICENILQPDEPWFIPSCDRDAVRVRRHAPGYHFEHEYVRLESGVWLAFGELQDDEPFVNWTRERGVTTFSVLTRGVGALSTAGAPHQRCIFSEGQVVATACSDDTPVCRHIPPGVRAQSVTLLFEGDDALTRFGLDLDETRQWLAPPNEIPGRSRPFRAAVGTPSSLVQKAAQAILWAPFSGSRRRLYLRSKAGELMCHLLTTPASSFSGGEVLPKRPCTDDSLAAIAHAAMSDPECWIEIGDLAMRLQATSGRLVTAFRAKYGMSPREHMMAVRMAHARRLLRETQDPVVDVALACGYEHHSSFTAAYRKAFGEAPIQTRRGVASADRPPGGASRRPA
jgi:AraC-like DNA-binding protein